MVTATTTKTMPTTDIPDFAQKMREQLLSTIRQGQQLSIDAAHAWVKAVSVLPVPDLPKLPGLSVIPDVQTATKYTFDVAADLLNSQRDFALQLAKTFIPVKSV
jgi:hypothetical protein